MGKRPKNTSKTKCDWQTLTAPPHRRGKLILRDSAKKQSVTKPPLRERGRGTAKRWWGRKGIAACGIETGVRCPACIAVMRYTTHKAACGMSAPIGSLRSPLPPHRRGKLILHDPAKKQSVTKPPLRERGRGTAKRWWGRKGIAACGIETRERGLTFRSIQLLHHPQIRVRHERPYRLAALATY